MSIADKHTNLLDKFQKLIPKSCIITFPSDAVNSNYRNKQFIISQISASKLSTDRLKNSSSVFTNGAVEITILFSIIDTIKDRTNTLNAPKYGYKDNKAIVTYKSKNYIVKDELLNEFDTSITLLIDRTD